MGATRLKSVATASETAMRDQEVVRANRELAAYFKGLRTEREARAALKIIKAFVRDRERTDAKNRRPLPGTRAGKPSSSGGDKKAAAPKPRKTPKRRAPRPAAPAANASEPIKSHTAPPASAE